MMSDVGVSDFLLSLRVRPKRMGTITESQNLINFYKRRIDTICRLVYSSHHSLVT